MFERMEKRVSDATLGLFDDNVVSTVEFALNIAPWEIHFF